MYHYATFEQFASDVRRVFSNAILYHGGGAAHGGEDGQVPFIGFLPSTAVLVAQTLCVTQGPFVRACLWS